MGPLGKANLEIRQQLEVAERRQRADQLVEALRYLDRVIATLEQLVMTGVPELPEETRAAFARLARVLPRGVLAPPKWDNRPAMALEQCFQIEERIFRRRPQPHTSFRALGPGAAR